MRFFKYWPPERKSATNERRDHWSVTGTYEQLSPPVVSTEDSLPVSATQHCTSIITAYPACINHRLCYCPKYAIFKIISFAPHICITKR